MKLSGFTDEASNDPDVQIRITRELGWKYLSARTMGEKNIHDMDDFDFEVLCDKLESSEVRVAEFGTLIGNWAKSIFSDWQLTVREIDRCIPRMQRLNVKFARVMSYAQEPWGKDQHEKERFKRLREITSRFSAAGLTAAHENCMNYGGFSADHTLRLIEEVPDLKLVFDTGNPLFQPDRSKEEPFPWQDPLEFYHKVKEHIVHIHVKDGIMNNEMQYTFPGEGESRLVEILCDLKDRNYDGFIVIEPHMGKVFHEEFTDTDGDRQSQLYLEYGRRMEMILSQINGR